MPKKPITKKSKEITIEEKIESLLNELATKELPSIKIMLVRKFLNSLPVCSPEQRKFLSRIQEKGEYIDKRIEVGNKTVFFESDLDGLNLRKVLNGD